MCFRHTFRQLPSTIKFDGLPEIDESLEDYPLLPSWMFENLDEMDMALIFSA